MSSSQKKVLIISSHEPDRETMRLLLGSMGCPWILASTVEEGAKILGREPVAAAILDSGIVSWDFVPRNANLHAVVKFLPGRVILLLSERLDSRVVNFARANSLPIIKRERWAQELWGSLEEVLRRNELAFRRCFLRTSGRLEVDPVGWANPHERRTAAAASRSAGCATWPGGRARFDGNKSMGRVCFRIRKTAESGDRD